LSQAAFFEPVLLSHSKTKKTNIMARLFKSCASVFVLGVSVYFLFNSCAEQPLTSNPVPASTKNEITGITGESTNVPIFSSDVGAPIDRETAVRWMRNFAISNKNATHDYVIPVDLLKSILSSTSCVGVVLYYAVDDSKELHIIPIGVNSAGKVIAWKSITLGTVTIDWQTAWHWINSHDGAVRSHFFGSKILVSTYLENKNMRISRALNDAGLPQLLLSNGDVITPQGYGDESGPCPPFCPNY
jgi:hypothetical protein